MRECGNGGRSKRVCVYGVHVRVEVEVEMEVGVEGVEREWRGTREGVERE